MPLVIMTIDDAELYGFKSTEHVCVLWLMINTDAWSGHMITKLQLPSINTAYKGF